MPSAWIRALFVLAITSTASAQTVPTIGLYADPGGTDCNVVTAVGTPVKAYVVLVPRISPATLTEASIWVNLEFSSVVVSDVVPTALATFATGNPFTSTGALIQIQLCPTSTPVVLYTATLTRTSGPAWEIRVETNAEWTTCSLETFTTRSVTSIDHPGSPSVPANPSPEDGATVASACISQAHQELAWSGRIESTVCRRNHWRVYFGTTPSPPFVSANYSYPGFDVGRLSPNTTYYWRVETVVTNFGNPTDTILRGPLWRFTTGPPPESLPPPQACPTTCEPFSECPTTCLFTSDPSFSSHCANTVNGYYSVGRECGSGHSVEGIGSFDRSTGSVYAHVATEAKCGGSSIDVTSADRFWLDGPASGEPVAFSAHLSFSGSGGCFFGALQEGTGPVTFVPPAEPQPYRGGLELPLRHAPGETFVLRYGVMVSADTGPSGYASGNLTFSGVPPRYRIMSCEGYTGPQGVTPSSWSKVKTLFR